MRRLCIGGATALVSLVCAAPAFANHFRGGNMAAEISPAGVVTITANTLWRRGSEPPGGVDFVRLVRTGVPVGAMSVDIGATTTSLDTSSSPRSNLRTQRIVVALGAFGVPPGPAPVEITWTDNHLPAGMQNTGAQIHDLGAQIVWNGLPGESPRFAPVDALGWEAAHAAVKGQNYTADFQLGGAILFPRAYALDASGITGVAVDSTGVVSISASATSTLTDNPLNPGADYFYKLRIQDSRGFASSQHALLDAATPGADPKLGIAVTQSGTTQLTSTITVENIGSADATNVSLLYAVPYGMPWTTNDPGCPASGIGTFTCSDAALPYATRRTITVTSGIPTSGCGSTSASVSVSAGNEPPANTGNNSASAVVNPTCTTPTAQLLVRTEVTNDNGGGAAPADVSISVAGTNPQPRSFAGSTNGTVVTVGAGVYSVDAHAPSGYEVSLSSGCTGSVAGGETNTCTITADDEPPTVNVVTNVVNDDGGMADADDFTAGCGPCTPSSAPGSSTGTTYTLPTGLSYTITLTGPSGYTVTSSPGCTGTAEPLRTYDCAITADDEVDEDDDGIPDRLEVRITIVKDTVPDDAQDFSFTSLQPELDGLRLDDDDDPALPNQKSVLVAPGTLVQVREGLTPGWGLTDVDCTGGEQVPLPVPGGFRLGDLRAGDAITCIFTNERIPDEDGDGIDDRDEVRITIVKDSLPDDAQDFAFSSNIPELDPLVLDDDGNPAEGAGQLPDRRTFLIDAGATVELSEDAVPGWQLAGVDCTGQSSRFPNFPVGQPVRTENGIRWGPLPIGFEATCTFTNERIPDEDGDGIPDRQEVRLTIVKDFDPDSSQDVRFFSPTPELDGLRLDDDADATLPDRKTVLVAPGEHEIAETVPIGWKLAGVVCTGSGGSTAPGPQRSIDNGVAWGPLPAGFEGTCVFLNEPDPDEDGDGTPDRLEVKLTIIKDFEPDSGEDVVFFSPTPELDGIRLDEDGDPTLPDRKTVLVAPGEHEIVEAPPSGWRMTATTCVADIGSDPGGPQRAIANGVAWGPLPAGFQGTCVFRNERERDENGNGIPDRLEVILTVEKELFPADPQDFHFTSPQPELDGLTLDDDDDPALANTRTVALPAGTTVELHEEPTPGWRLSSAVCFFEGITDPGLPDSFVELPDGVRWGPLDPGAKGTCIFRNVRDPDENENGIPDRLEVRLTVRKLVHPDDAQDFRFASPQPELDGLTLHDDGSLENNTRTVVLPAGTTVELHEEPTPGWRLSSVSCSFQKAGSGPVHFPVELPDGVRWGPLNPGAEGLCEFVNERDPDENGNGIPDRLEVKLTIVKDTVPDHARDFRFASPLPELDGLTLDDDADPTLANQTTVRLAPGVTVELHELAQPGWTLTAVQCGSGGGSGPVPVPVRLPDGVQWGPLSSGSQASCRFVNEPDPDADALASFAALLYDENGNGRHDAGERGDNCNDTFNPDQADLDADGEGDACDRAPNDATPGAVSQTDASVVLGALATTLTTPDGGATLSLPPGALPAGTTLTVVRRPDGQPCTGQTPGGDAFTCVVLWRYEVFVGGSNGTALLAAPALLTATFTSGTAWPIGILTLAELDPATAVVSPACRPDPVFGDQGPRCGGIETVLVNGELRFRITVPLEHFSTYAAIVLDPPRDIVFASTRSGNGDLYSVDPGGGTPTQLTSGSAIDAEPAWSPDKRRVAFTSTRDGNVELYAMDADGTDVIRLTTNAAIDTSPAWSPDGTTIAFASNRGGGNWDVYVMPAGGGAATRLTTHAAADTFPAWSSDGTKIAFSSLRTGAGDIYAMNADGTAQTRLTTAAGIDTEPDWSGTTIAFSTNRHGLANFEVYTMNADGSAQTRRTNQAGLDVTPSWSPDGDELVFASNRTGILNFELYTMTADGTGLTPLTAHPAVDAFPAW
ncbi:MAG: prealbumin-like fold domain-containing protein [Gaiellales bacterium]